MLTTQRNSISATTTTTNQNTFRLYISFKRNGRKGKPKSVKQIIDITISSTMFLFFCASRHPSLNVQFEIFGNEEHSMDTNELRIRGQLPQVCIECKRINKQQQKLFFCSSICTPFVIIFRDLTAISTRICLECQSNCKTHVVGLCIWFVETTIRRDLFRLTHSDVLCVHHSCVVSASASDIHMAPHTHSSLIQ